MSENIDSTRVTAAGGAARRVTPAQHVTPAKTVPDAGDAPAAPTSRSNMQDQIDAAAVPPLPAEAWYRKPILKPQERAAQAMQRRAARDAQE